jgi:hypothetical protein
LEVWKEGRKTWIKIAWGCTAAGQMTVICEASRLWLAGRAVPSPVVQDGLEVTCYPNHLEEAIQKIYIMQ